MIKSTEIRAQFPSLRREHNNYPMIFLDGPGGTQVPDKVINAIVNYYKMSNSNTHGEFITTNETDAVISNARKSAAALLGAEDEYTISLGQNMTT